jgi:hypothetical protein
VGKQEGASFEGEKTSFIHFTRNRRQSANGPILIKILGLVMDSRLWYQAHTAHAATRGLRAAMALKRLGGLTQSVTRRLFNAAVALVVDYASSAWMNARGPPRRGCRGLVDRR